MNGGFGRGERVVKQKPQASEINLSAGKVCELDAVGVAGIDLGDQHDGQSVRQGVSVQKDRARIVGYNVVVAVARGDFQGERRVEHAGRGNGRKREALDPRSGEAVDGNLDMLNIAGDEVQVQHGGFRSPISGVESDANAEGAVGWN